MGLHVERAGCLARPSSWSSCWARRRRSRTPCAEGQAGRSRPGDPTGITASCATASGSTPNPARPAVPACAPGASGAPGQNRLCPSTFCSSSKKSGRHDGGGTVTSVLSVSESGSTAEGAMGPALPETEALCRSVPGAGPGGDRDSQPEVLPFAARPRLASLARPSVPGSPPAVCRPQRDCRRGA